MQQKMTSKEVRKEGSYWDTFYANFEIAVPSQFCVMMLTEISKERPVVEFGCGNGRDAIYMSHQGFSVFAGDLSHEVIKNNREKEQNSSNAATFELCDVSKPIEVKSLIQMARESRKHTGGKTNVTFYNRFFLHTLDDEQENLFLKAVSEEALPGDLLFAEFRCSLDAKQDHLFQGHYRRYVETDKLVKSLEQELGFEINYQMTGQGMAKYKQEDPFISRIIATKSSG